VALGDRISRAGWGALPPARSPNGIKPARRPGIEVHHSVTPEDPIPVTPDLDLDESMRRIQRFHLHGRGWSDIFYNESVSLDGTRAEGRSWGYRSGSLASLTVCVIGNYDDTQPTDAVKHAIHDVRRDLIALGGGGEIRWHGQRGGTRCPGRHLIDWLEAGAPEPKRDTRKVLPAYDPPLTLEPIVDTLAAPEGGLWQLAASGAVYAWGGAPYFGGMNQPHLAHHFDGRSAARLLPRDDGRDGYVIIATSGESYSLPA